MRLPTGGRRLLLLAVLLLVAWAVRQLAAPGVGEGEEILPVLAEELAEYGPYRHMYELAYPGLTGAWQVAGRTGIRYPERAHLDAEYVEQWTLPQDLALIVRTIPALFDRSQST